MIAEGIVKVCSFNTFINFRLKYLRKMRKRPHVAPSRCHLALLSPSPGFSDIIREHRGLNRRIHKSTLRDRSLVQCDSLGFKRNVNNQYNTYKINLAAQSLTDTYTFVDPPRVIIKKPLRIISRSRYYTSSETQGQLVGAGGNKSGKEMKRFFARFVSSRRD